jgi:hypothetical protein
MQSFETQLRNLVHSLERDPNDAERRAALERLLDEQPGALEASVDPLVLSFGTTAAARDRRLRFLRHLLLHGYWPPRVETVDGTAWQNTINLGVVTSYFYPNALSLLEAGCDRADMGVFVAAAPASDGAPWITRVPGSPPRVLLHAALMMDDGGLVWRRFENPIPIHYLFPVDNYYRDKFRLVNEWAHCGVPMAGSTIIRDVCERKELLWEIAGTIPDLRLARETYVTRSMGEGGRAAAIDRFCAEHDLHDLVSKPLDAFGGIGVDFWRYPADRDRLLARLREALTARPQMLVQERIVPVATASGRDWNLRQYVLRRTPNAILSAWKRVRAGHGVINTTQGAHSLTVAALLGEIDVLPGERAAFEAALHATDRLAVAVMEQLDRYLHSQFADQHQPYIGSGSNLEPDLLALDFMIARDRDQGGGFAVYLNEINDFASGGLRDYEVLAHREALPDAPRVRATQPFSLAPALLDLAYWRGSGYKRAVGG